MWALTEVGGTEHTLSLTHSQTQTHTHTHTHTHTLALVLNFMQFAFGHFKRGEIDVEVKWKFLGKCLNEISKVF